MSDMRTIAMRIFSYMCGVIVLTCLMTVNAFTLQLPETSPTAQTPTAQTPTTQTPMAQQTATPQPIPTPEHYTWSELGLVATALLVLAGLFVSVMLWSARLERTHYLGTLYLDFVKDYEFKRLARNAEQRWTDGDYHAKVVQDDQSLINEFPEIPEVYANHWWCRRVSDSQSSSWWRSELLDEGRTFSPGLGSRRPGGNLLPGIDLETQNLQSWQIQQITKEREEDRAKTAYEKRLNGWKFKVARAARTRYDKDLAQYRKEAAKRAKNAISIDFAALRGRGREFVLEFTAIVVIIFSAVVLGILRILHGDHIATLLAAIAGYVLGRATTRAQGATDRTQRGETAPTVETIKPVDTSQLTELLRVVTGSKSTADQPPNVSINEPVATGEQFVSTEPCVVIRGRATDDSYVTDVQWQNVTTGKSGAATLSDGTTARDWRSPELTLNQGSNEITVESRDASGNRSAPAKITVKYEPLKTRTNGANSNAQQTNEAEEGRESLNVPDVKESPEKQT